MNMRGRLYDRSALLLMYGGLPQEEVSLETECKVLYICEVIQFNTDAQRKGEKYENSRLRNIARNGRQEMASI